MAVAVHRAEYHVASFYLGFKMGFASFKIPVMIIKFSTRVFNNVPVKRFHLGNAADHKHPFGTELILGAGFFYTIVFVGAIHGCTGDETGNHGLDFLFYQLVFASGTEQVNLKGSFFTLHDPCFFLFSYKILLPGCYFLLQTADGVFRFFPGMKHIFQLINPFFYL